MGSSSVFSESIGQGTHRYNYQLIKNFDKLEHNDINIEKRLFNPLPSIFEGFSPLIYTPFMRLNSYDIIQEFASPCSRVGYGKAIVVGVVHDFHVLTDYMQNIEEYRTLRGFLGLHLFGIPSIKYALRADYLFPNSTQTKEEAVHFGFDRRKLLVINHGISKKFIRDPPSKLNKTDKDTFRVGYIGSFSTPKNVGFAIKAFLKTTSNDMIFDVWGARTGQYYNLINLAKGDHRIRFRGFVPESRLVSTYDSFDVFVHPSLYEGFGLQIFEAQARGLPVVIYKHTKTPKEVRRYCIEVEDEDHMASIIEELRTNGYNEKRRKIAMDYARGFTWEKTAMQTLDAYRWINKKENF